MAYQQNNKNLDNPTKDCSRENLIVKCAVCATSLQETEQGLDYKGFYLKVSPGPCIGCDQWICYKCELFEIHMQPVCKNCGYIDEDGNFKTYGNIH